MATALFGTTVVPSFLGHLGSAEARELNFLWYLTKPLQGEDELLSSAVSTGPGALPGTWWVSHQNVLWVGEVMTFVRFHNMWSNYNLESVPIPRCDFYFFFCLIFLFLQWIRQNKKKKKKKEDASGQNAHWFFRTNPKTNFAVWGQSFLKMTQ